MRMEQVRRKLKSARGESLVELLASTLIAGLSAALLAAMIITSARMNDSVQKGDEDYYENLAHAEAQDVSMEAVGGTGATGSIEVSCDGGYVGSIQIPVKYYGGDDVLSYKIQSSTEGGGGGGTS